MTRAYLSLLRFVFFTVFLFVCRTVTTAQHLIAIDAASQQSFSVAWAGRSFQSSDEGHLILSNLPDSSINLVFRTTEHPIEEFLIRLDGLKKDRGFILKKYNEGEWALFDWQSLEWLKSKNPLSMPATTMANLNAFSSLLAANVNDPSIVESSKENTPQKNASIIAKISSDTPAVRAIAPSIALPKNTAAAKHQEIPVIPVIPATDKDIDYAKPTIVKSSVELKKDTIAVNTRQLVYQISKEGDPVESIQIEIPLAEEKLTIKLAEVPKLEDSVRSAPKNENSIPVPEVKATLQPAPVISMINSDCKIGATDLQVEKLHAKMLRADRASQRTEVAARFLKDYCMTSKQIKSLAHLFFVEEDLYLFLEKAYPFVSDTDQFKSLLELFINDQYRSRFKVLARITP